MHPCLRIALCLTVTLAVAGPARAQGSLDDAVRRYLAARTDAERDALATRLAPHDGLTAARYARAIERALGYPDLKRERRPLVRSVEIGDGRKVDVHVQVPSGYDPRRKAWPVLVAFTGPSTDGRASLATWQRAFNDYIVAAPSLPADNPTYAGRPKYETALRTFEALLDALAGEMRIDHDRVFVAGHSHGGAIAWFCAAYHADRVAGAVPAAGNSTYDKEDLVNLAGTPVFVIHGKNDDAVPVAASRESVSWLERFGHDFVYHEFDGGHEFPTAKIPDILAWMATRKRAPDRARLRHRTSGQWNTTGRIAWVRVVRPDPLDDIVDLTASVDAASNRVDIRIDGVQEIEVLLNERLVDPQRDVAVVLNGAEVFRGRVPFRARAALDSYRARRDPGAIHPGVVRLRVEKGRD